MSSGLIQKQTGEEGRSAQFGSSGGETCKRHDAIYDTMLLTRAVRERCEEPGRSLVGDWSSRARKFCVACLQFDQHHHTN